MISDVAKRFLQHHFRSDDQGSVDVGTLSLNGSLRHGLRRSLKKLVMCLHVVPFTTRLRARQANQSIWSFVR